MSLEVEAIEKDKSLKRGEHNDMEDNREVEVLAPEKKKTVRQRRRRVPDRPNIHFNLWTLIRNSIGKDLTKIPFPVNYSEPLSMLQRITESDVEYADLLDKAATIQDDCEQVTIISTVAK